MHANVIPIGVNSSFDLTKFSSHSLVKKKQVINQINPFHHQIGAFENDFNERLVYLKDLKKIVVRHKIFSKLI